MTTERFSELPNSSRLILEKLMEEMANAPREELGKRQPGELSTYAGEHPWQKK